MDWAPEYYIDQYLRAINSVTRLNFNDGSIRKSMGGLIGELNIATEKSQEIINNTLAILHSSASTSVEAETGIEGLLPLPLAAEPVTNEVFTTEAEAFKDEDE
jgi:hypothetical protein